MEGSHVDARSRRSGKRGRESKCIGDVVYEGLGVYILETKERAKGEGIPGRKVGFCSRSFWAFSIVPHKV